MSDEAVEGIHCGDALAFMRGLPDASIDAIVTDPPYCSGAFSEAARQMARGQGLWSETLRADGWFIGDNMGTAGLIFLLRAMAFEAARVVKSTGSLVVFCDWRMIPSICPAIESAGLRYQAQITWDKCAIGLGCGFRARSEMALHFTFGKPAFWATDVSNVIACPRVPSDEREHQAQKPVKLLADIIRVVCPPGGIVLDPFAGSGSVGVAAKSIGRRWCMVDRDPEHVATAANRIAGVDPVDPQAVSMDLLGSPS